MSSENIKPRIIAYDTAIITPQSSQVQNTQSTSPNINGEPPILHSLVNPEKHKKNWLSMFNILKSPEDKPQQRASSLMLPPDEKVSNDPLDAAYYWMHKKKPEFAVRFLEVSSNQSNPVGMYLFALSLMHQWGIPKRDPKRAFELFRCAAENLVLLYLSGSISGDYEYHSSIESIALGRPTQISMLFPNNSGDGVDLRLANGESLTHSSLGSSSIGGVGNHLLSDVILVSGEKRNGKSSGAMDVQQKLSRKTTSKDQSTFERRRSSVRRTSTISAHKSTTQLDVIQPKDRRESNKTKKLIIIPRRKSDHHLALRNEKADPEAEFEHDQKCLEMVIALILHEIAICYRLGWGVRRWSRMAFTFMNIAAQLGLPESQYQLAFMCENGIGSVKNTIAASYWCMLAMENGYDFNIGGVWEKHKFEDVSEYDVKIRSDQELIEDSRDLLSIIRVPKGMSFFRRLIIRFKLLRSMSHDPREMLSIARQNNQ